MLAAGLFLAAATLPVAAAAPEPPPPPRAIDGPFAAEIVTLPPYELDAVEPPWAKDTRTAITTSVSLDPGSALTMADALRASPGVHVDQPGGPGGRSSLYLQGGEENYAVVLLDGVPVNNPTDSRGGGFDFGTLDVSEFAAVEIVRGPVSARYGPDALSGVVKLTSDVMGPQNGSRMSLEAGTHGRAAGDMAAGAQQDNLTTAASVHWSQDGSRAAGNFARHEAVATGVTWRGPAVEWRLSLRYGWEDSAAFPDDSGGERLAVLRSLEERSGSTTTAAIELLSPGGRTTGIKWRVRSWGAWLHAHDNSPGVAPGLRDPIGLPASLEATTLRRGGFSAEGDAEVGGSGALAVGVDGESEQGKSDAVLVYGPFPIPAPFSASRDRVGTFAEYTWRPADGWLVQPSVRLDKARDYSPRFILRLGLKAPVGARTVLRVNAGTGFKLPSFYAVSNPLVGNPGLRPEKARTVDVGLEHQLAGGMGTLEIGGFSSRYRDGIDFDPGPPPRLVNRDEIRSDGMEVALRLRLGDSVDLGCSGTCADVRSEPGGGRLRGRPRTEGAVRAEWRPVKGFAIEAALVAVGRVLDSSVPTGDVLLPEWRRLSLAGRYEVHRGVGLTVGVENLLNTRYEEAIGVPSPGVRWRGGIEARF
jgi:outer membrane cobalamin receptor